MAVFSLFILSFVFCVLIVTSSISQANNTLQNYHYYCDFNQARGNYTANSTYSRNLNTLLSTLTSNTEIDYGFYNFTFGENTDQVYAIGLCRGDVNKEKCRSCLEYSRVQLTQLCPNQKEAIGWYDDEKCMLRYSDRSIFGLNEIRPGYYLWYTNNTLNSTQQEQFDRVLMDLLYSLRSKASSGDSRVKYATESATGPDNKTIYGLMQCTPDLSETDCHDCLLESVRELPTCCSKTIGPTYVRASCILRYETSALFYGPPAYSPPSPPPPLPPPPPGESNRTAIAISIAVPLAVVALVFIFIFIFFRVRKPGKKLKKPNDDDDDDQIDISESLQFNFNTIREATNDFSDSNKLGQGGFGTVYKGRLSNGQEIAVKRLSTNSRQGDIEFKNEVVLVAKLQHRNLVRLLGFCLEGRERLLVYEFVPNKSLDYFIFDQTKRAQLDWEKRYKIIAGIARGILYLHRDSRLRIIHRDLKASNILLDEEMNPKISDFGLARIFVMNQTHGDTNRIVGTYGYMAPEYAMHGQFSEKSDVFSFGVLILEIVSGQKNSGISHGEHIEDLLNFVWRNWKEGTTTNIVDPTLNKVSENEITRCIHIGLLCVQENVAARPTMASVILVLNSDSVTLPVPLEPAFYVDDRTGNLPDKQLWEFNSGTRSSECITRSDQQSINEVSITDPYLR